MSEGPKWMQCPVCKETLYWKVPVEALKDVKRFPAAIVVKHHDHYLIIYLDSHLQLADTEIVSAYVESQTEK
ncbi:MAG: hypothetical protein ACTSPE_06395 [Candidatus Thorarchaeota archaeon]|nr:MAG: hypothetical protein DRO73_04590 [Candidatus Thorarchaeota archaeon]RLI62114.1 MAG: hypothetical protein DRO93_02255 [Candidatus Thorarchaeota archaeon]